MPKNIHSSIHNLSTKVSQFQENSTHHALNHSKLFHRPKTKYLKFIGGLFNKAYFCAFMKIIMNLIDILDLRNLNG